jgi:adenylate cyclase
MVESGERRLRRRLDQADATGEFPMLDELAASGASDYLALITPLAGRAAIGGVEHIYSSWAATRAGGFGESELATLEQLVPTLALGIAGVSTGRIADTLMETYLGHDAGRRVLSGNIERGVAERIRAVLWFSDLRGFTRIAETSAPEQVIPFLNDYADCLVGAIHAHGGQVMKFMGDGILAIFAIDQAGEGCRRALDAADDALGRLAALNARRAGQGMPVTGAYLGLHIGEVFYGNVGSVDRLDFTVVGPAVNEVVRIEAMCRSIDQDVILSSAFAEAAVDDRARLVSLGRYALRGVRAPQELFTVDGRGAPAPGLQR